MVLKEGQIEQRFDLLQCKVLQDFTAHASMGLDDGGRPGLLTCTIVLMENMIDNSSEVPYCRVQVLEIKYMFRFVRIVHHKQVLSEPW